MTEQEYIKIIKDASINLVELYKKDAANFTPRVMEAAIKRKIALYTLYTYGHRRITSDLLRLWIEAGEYLWILYEKCTDKITPQIMTLIINKQANAWAMYRLCYNKMSDKMIEKAIEVWWRDLKVLINLCGDRLNPKLLELVNKKNINKFDF